METLKGFLLSYLKYGDSDAILHIFTYEQGFQSFFVKGIFSSRSKKKALLSPLFELSLGFKIASKNGTIQNLNSLEIFELRNFHDDIKIQSILFFVAEFLNSTLKNENESHQVYTEILNFLDELENKNYFAHYSFLVRLLHLLGHAPLLSENFYLNPESGKFENAQSHPVFTQEISEFWKETLSKTEEFSKKNKNLRKEILDSIMVYYQFHFDGFRKPKSLEIVREVFED